MQASVFRTDGILAMRIATAGQSLRDDDGSRRENAMNLACKWGRRSARACSLLHDMHASGSRLMRA
ncbi:hypothetical protein CH75_08255 [Dyella jiangningensis]|nr:hypothetical protein CH75_08255 [Dyella jiangningensis]